MAASLLILQFFNEMLNADFQIYEEFNSLSCVPCDTLTQRRNTSELRKQECIEWESKSMQRNRDSLYAFV